MSDAAESRATAPATRSATLSSAAAPRPAPPAPAPPAAATPKPPATSEPKSDSSWATLWLTDRDIAIFTALGAVVLVLLVVRWGQLSGWGAREIEIERLAPQEHVYRLDLNEATWVELAQLDGIGETLAVRIVADREANGPFRTVEDLDRVKGIGPKTVERLRAFVRVGESEERE